MCPTMTEGGLSEGVGPNQYLPDSHLEVRDNCSEAMLYHILVPHRPLEPPLAKRREGGDEVR